MQHDQSALEDKANVIVDSLKKVGKLLESAEAESDAMMAASIKSGVARRTLVKNEILAEAKGERQDSAQAAERLLKIVDEVSKWRVLYTCVRGLLLRCKS